MSGFRSVARRITALLLLAMVAAQLSDPSGFVDVIETYEFGGRAVAWIVASLLVLG